MLVAENNRIERLEELKRINERARQEALERVERERIEAEQKAAAKAKADKEEEARLAAMRSDAEKVHDYAKFFAGFLAPPVGLKSKAAVGACREAYEAVIAAGKKLQEFKAR